MKIGKFFLKKRFGNAATDKPRPEDVGATDAILENEEKVTIKEEDERVNGEPSINAPQESNRDTSAASPDSPYDEVREEPPSCDPTEELIVEVSHKDTASSYDSGESYDEEDITYFDNATLSIASQNHASERQGERPNYFHKDVVVSSLDTGMIGLVLRAMYFVPKPCASDHVVLKVEVRIVIMLDDERTMHLCSRVSSNLNPFLLMTFAGIHDLQARLHVMQGRRFNKRYVAIRTRPRIRRYYSISG